MFDKDKLARSVAVVTAGLEYEISASKEVILSAGAVKTPSKPRTLRVSTLSAVVSFTAVADGLWRWSFVYLEELEHPNSVRFRRCRSGNVGVCEQQACKGSRKCRADEVKRTNRTTLWLTRSTLPRIPSS